MAVNKDKNSYTFFFAIIMVVIVGSGLASISVWLKPRQERNLEIKKKMDILGALKVDDVTRKNAEELYAQYVNEDQCLVLTADGNVKEGVDAFEVNVQKQFRDKKLEESDREYPLFVAEVDGGKKYVIPVVGSGLWGPIWGYLSIEEDKRSIFGAQFDHKGETPGLGAEIKQEFFYSQFESETISESGQFIPIKVVKDGSGSQPHRVDGITGGTITSKGVEEMVNRTLEVYVEYFNK